MPILFFYGTHLRGSVNLLEEVVAAKESLLISLGMRFIQGMPFPISVMYSKLLVPSLGSESKINYFSK